MTDVYFASYGCSNCCEVANVAIECRRYLRSQSVDIADRSLIAAWADDRFDQSDRAHLIESWLSC
jgi:hypothetical protein